MLSPKSLLFLAGSTLAAVHTVDVGESGLQFDPETLTPAVGDTVIFHLYPQHNVVAGPFNSPCQPSTGNVSFFSGPFSGTNNGAKKFVVNVTSTDPVYYYCAVPNHCRAGMVGGWNLPSSGNNIAAYKSAATSASSASAPSALTGGQLLEDSQLASATASVSATPTSNSSSSGTAASNSGSPSASGSKAPSSTSAGAPGNSPAAAVNVGVPGAMAFGLGVAAFVL